MYTVSVPTPGGCGHCRGSDHVSMRAIRYQFRALGRHELPREVELCGRIYRLRDVLKHDFISAVGLYGHEGDRIVCKFHRQAAFFGVPLGGLGRLAASHECAVLGQLSDIEGVPALRGSPAPGVVARDFIPGKPLERGCRVDGEFFPRLLDLLAQVHSRGVAYVDLEKPQNILVGEDGRPYLIDFQAAFYVPRRFLGETSLLRYIRKSLQRADLYHVAKHWRRIMPGHLTHEQIARSRARPLCVTVGNGLTKPFKVVRRWLLRKFL